MNPQRTRDTNIERYGKMLRGNLTDIERRFVEQRLEEEKARRQAPEAPDAALSEEFCQ
jgi:hypothetical protein